MKIRTYVIMMALCILASCGRRSTAPSVLVMETTMGDIEFTLYDETPLHKENFLKLTREHYFDSLLFHRVIENFMIQGGDPDSRNAVPGAFLGDGGPDYTVPAEFRLEQGIFHRRGVLAAAREGDDVNPEQASSASQFYFVWGRVFDDEGLDKQQERLDSRTGGKVVLTPEMREVYKTVGGTPHLDGQYTVFGEITRGLDVVDAIQKVATDENDRPLKDVRILRVYEKGSRQEEFRLEAHRGIADRYPENTLYSYMQAAREDVYAGIETDVQMTSDSVLVCMHDNTIDRTTNGTGKVSDYTLAELQEFLIDGGYGWDDSYAGMFRVPTFESYLEVMQMCGKIPYVELKLLDEAGISRTVSMLHDMGFDGKYVLTSFNKDYLLYARGMSDAPIEYMQGNITPEYVQACVDNGFIIRPSSTKLSAEQVAEWQSRGLRVEAYGLPVGNAELLACLKEWGVRGVTCNDWLNLGY